MSFTRKGSTGRSESSIEQTFVRAMKRYGHIVLKLTPQGAAGYPDRIVILEYGRVVFVEFKRPGKKATKLQEERIKQLRAKNHWAKVFDCPYAAADWVLGYAAIDAHVLDI